MDAKELLFRYIDLPERVARKLGVPFDTISELALNALEKAANTFDEDRGSFRGYAEMVVRNEILKSLRTELDASSLPNQLVDLKKPFRHLPLSCISKLEGELSKVDYEILVARFVDGETLEEISHAYGLGRGAIHVRIKKILAKVQRFIQTNQES